MLGRTLRLGLACQPFTSTKMAGEKAASDDDFAGTDYSSADAEGNLRVKVICLGDSAVGKSK